MHNYKKYRRRGLKSNPLHDSNFYLHVACYILPCTSLTHIWIFAELLHSPDQAGRGHLLVTDCQHCNTGYTHVDHPIRQGAFAPFNTAEVHISGFDCCLDNCTVFYAVTTNQSVLGVTGGLTFDNMKIPVTAEDICSNAALYTTANNAVTLT